MLCCRLTLYPEYAAQANKWLDTGGGKSGVAAAVLHHSDAEGYLRGSNWAAGRADSPAECSGESGEASKASLEDLFRLPEGSLSKPRHAFEFSHCNSVALFDVHAAVLIPPPVVLSHMPSR